MGRLLRRACARAESAVELCDIDRSRTSAPTGATGHSAVLISPGGVAMKTISAFVYIALLTASGLAFAAAPVLKVTKSVTIDAPAAKVWSQIGAFGGLNTWHPAVESDKIVEGSDNKPGAVRLLTLKGGGTIKEKLLAHSDAKHMYKYEILEGVLPVSHYSSTLRVAAAGKDKAKVTWSGSFQRKDTGPKPADDANDKTASDTISGVYQGGLDNLKKMVEGK
jgi:mxaD protein